MGAIPKNLKRFDWTEDGMDRHADGAFLRVDQVLQTLASKEAELAEAGLKYVSLFGELQNAMAEIKRLNKAFRDCMALMGPKAPPCCQGCEYEWTAALKIISAALTTTPQPTE